MITVMLGKVACQCLMIWYRIWGMRWREEWNTYLLLPGMQINEQGLKLIAKLITEKYLKKMRAYDKISMKSLGALVHEGWNMKIEKQKLWRARRHTFNIIYEDEIAQYNKLWDYATELRRSNPGSAFFLDTDQHGQFNNFSFDACKKGFLSDCRHVLFFDGCHLKIRFGGVLLTTTGMNPNDWIYPVAFVVVQIENTEGWEWLLSALK